VGGRLDTWAVPLGVGRGVALALDAPVMKMAVGPAHGRLHDAIAFCIAASAMAGIITCSPKGA